MVKSRPVNIPDEWADLKFGFWQKKPVKFKWWIINIHFYRTPQALGLKRFIYGHSRWQLTWEEWERRIQKVCPYQYFLRKKVIEKTCIYFECLWKYKILWKFYTLKKRLTNPDNILKLKKLDVYASESDRILHSLFQILVNFVESKPEDKVKLNSTPEDADWWGQVNCLYKYWTIERPAILIKIDQSYPTPEDRKNDKEQKYDVLYAKVNALEKALYEKDTAALKFIIETRERFWS